MLPQSQILFSVLTLPADASLIKQEQRKMRCAANKKLAYYWVTSQLRSQ
jgi:hypothetical protein